MGVKHIEKTSLIDYPCHISCILFFGGCNFRCGYCYNNDLVLEPDTIPDILIDEIAGFLDKRKHLIEGVVLTGGEPTLDQSLFDIIAMIKEKGLKVKLDTNGYCSDVLKMIIDRKLADYIAMDIKAGLGDYNKVCGVTVEPEKIRQSVDMIKSSSMDYEFRTTVWKGFFDFYDPAGIISLVQGSRRYYLHNYFSVDQDYQTFQPEVKAAIGPVIKMMEKSVERLDFRGDWY